MNEEQSNELISVLKDIRELLKPKQEIVKKEILVRPESVEKLKNFKTVITSNEFFNSLTDEQKKIVLKDTCMDNLKDQVCEIKNEAYKSKVEEYVRTTKFDLVSLDVLHKRILETLEVLE